MKLRNKKTGQEGNFIINKDHFECVDLDYVPEYRNLAELNAEWEDAPEEPKEYWFICDYSSSVRYAPADNNAVSKYRKEIVGNYFETKEEAEKAVEKLKAWIRLKDKGFRFEGWFGGSKDISYRLGAWVDEDTAKDLDLLFGVEG